MSDVTQKKKLSEYDDITPTDTTKVLAYDPSNPVGSRVGLMGMTEAVTAGYTLEEIWSGSKNPVNLTSVTDFPDGLPGKGRFAFKISGVSVVFTADFIEGEISISETFISSTSDGSGGYSKLAFYRGYITGTGSLFVNKYTINDGGAIDPAVTVTVTNIYRMR